MKLSRQGQVVIEYVTIAVLIMAGIMIIGPTVVRSINAFFQSATEGVQDSMTEEFVQGPETGFRNVTTCDCDPLTLGCGAGTCLPTERYVTWDCNPPGCYLTIGLVTDCTPDDTCCLRSPTGHCGVNADTINGGQITGGCPDGTMEIREICGDNDITYVCSNTLGGLYPSPYPGCEFHCIGELHPEATWCDPAGYASRLTGDTAIIYVAYNMCGTVNNNKCVAYCPDGWLPTLDGCVLGPTGGAGG